jgi:hypothetical protein
VCVCMCANVDEWARDEVLVESGCGMWDVGCGMWDVGCGMYHHCNYYYYISRYQNAHLDAHQIDPYSHHES